MIIHIISIAIITTVLSVLLKQHRPELSLCVSIAGGLVILLMFIPYMQDAVDGINKISSIGKINNEYVSLIMRVIAIAYITEIGASIARDAGEGALAMKVELGGKLAIFSMCIPVLLSLIETILMMIN